MISQRVCQLYPTFFLWEPFETKSCFVLLCFFNANRPEFHTLWRKIRRLLGWIWWIQNWGVCMTENSVVCCLPCCPVKIIMKRSHSHLHFCSIYQVTPWWAPEMHLLTAGLRALARLIPFSLFNWQQIEWESFPNPQTKRYYNYISPNMQMPLFDSSVFFLANIYLWSAI